MNNSVKLDPNKVAINPLNNALVEEANQLLSGKHSQFLKPGEKLLVQARHGDHIVFLRALLGSEEKGDVFEAFIELDDKQKPEDLFGDLVDFLDGVLKEFFKLERNAGLALDFMKCSFGELDVFARQEFRNFEAERLADEFLENAEKNKN